MSVRLVSILIIVLASCLGPALPNNNVDAVGSTVAFPGAEGYGAQSIGGRAGRVIEVTNLNDSGPGSLRAAIEAEGPRTVVFRLGGTIELRTPLEIENPYITIAGQTAPGGGIAIKTDETMDGAALEINAEHVIVRYIRVRPGPMTETSQNVDALIIGRNARHVIVDHCSFSWSTDETISVWYDSSDITIQWSIISEALMNSTHDAGPQSYGLLIGNKSSRISLHHNLFAHNHRRNPRISGGHSDLVNNIIYNSGSTPSRLNGNSLDGNDAPASVNFVGNLFKPGPSSDFAHEVKMLASENGSPFTAFISDNLGPNRPDNSVPDLDIVHPEGHQFMVDDRHEAPFVTTTSAEVAYDQVLTSAGAILPARDAVDERVVNDVLNTTGRIIDDPSEVGGWPQLTNGEPPTDGDRDGMPDAWEMLYGFDPVDAGDGSLDANNDGYTNLEEYLNGTSPIASPTATLMPTATHTPNPTSTLFPTSQPPSIHIGRLDGSSSLDERGTKWKASATILIDDVRHAPVVNAQVIGSWSGITSGSASCVTDVNGQCSVEKAKINFKRLRREGYVTFTVANVTSDGSTYLPIDDHNINNGDVGRVRSGQSSVTILQPDRLYVPYTPG